MYIILLKRIYISTLKTIYISTHFNVSIADLYDNSAFCRITVYTPFLI